jgi:hypothetical protein
MPSSVMPSDEQKDVFKSAVDKLYALATRHATALVN